MTELESCLHAIRDWIKAEDHAEHTAQVMATTDQPERLARAKADEKRQAAVDALRAAINAASA